MFRSPFYLRATMPFAVALMFSAGASHVSAQLTQGDLVVSAYGTPTSSGLIDGQAVPISLQDFTASTTATGETANTVTVLTGIDGEYGSSSEGNIQMTSSGTPYLTIAGYNATQAAAGIGAYTAGSGGTTNYPGNNGDSSSSSWADNQGQPYGGTAASGATYSSSTEVPLAQSSPIDVARVADVVDLNGNVVSTTSFSDIYNTNNARSAYSPNGSSIYISGQGDSKSDGDEGIYYSPTTGASYAGTPTATSNPPPIYTANDTRFVSGYNGNLYYSLDKKNNPTGVYMYSGLPTTSQGTSVGTAITSGKNANGTYNSPEGFWFANSTTLYVADTGVPKYSTSAVSGAGGIQKWTETGGVWSLQYVLTPTGFVSPSLAQSATSGQTGFEAIAGELVNGTVDLYAVSYTASDDNPNGVYAIADPLAATTAGTDTFTELAAAPGNGDENFKGVAFVTPEPSTWMMLLGGMGLLTFWAKRARRLAA